MKDSENLFRFGEESVWERVFNWFSDRNMDDPFYYDTAKKVIKSKICISLSITIPNA